MFQRVPVWNDWVNGPEEDKLGTSPIPAWRSRARESWDNRTRSRLSRLDRPNEMILTESETGAGPVGISLAEYAEQRELHISDALAEWVLRNGIHVADAGHPEQLSETAIVARAARAANARQHQRQWCPPATVRRRR